MTKKTRRTNETTTTKSSSASGGPMPSLSPIRSYTGWNQNTRQTKGATVKSIKSADRLQKFVGVARREDSISQYHRGAKD
jgi:hypothetical protein